MAVKAKKSVDLYDEKGGTPESRRRGYWQSEIDKAKKRWAPFYRKAQEVVDRYRLEKTDEEQTDVWRDRYNILYSSTETTTPSLYAQTPKVQATKRHRDRTNDTVTYATMLLESAAQYELEEFDFDGVMMNVVQDYLLAGIGQLWVRYDPTIKGANDNGEGGYVSGERALCDYVHFKDYITGQGRIWEELPWQARRVFFTKKKAIKRFGKEKADKLKYSFRPSDNAVTERTPQDGGGWQAIIYEIWDKENRQVIWFSEDYPDDLLDVKADILKLKDFWPCPRPVRAIFTTNKFIPKSFYSQYKAQAEQLDSITERIRWLTQALRVIGVYDASMEALQQLFNGVGNKMVPVENWSQFSGQGGMAGVISYVPIKDVAEVLRELYNQREIAKNEIYEITGFSDIVRGVSKASETLGAQKLKADWAGGRLKHMQKEIQRFCRDAIRLISEIQAEHYDEASLALAAGFEPPETTPEEHNAAAQYAAAKMQYDQQIQAQLTLPPGSPPPQAPQPPPPTGRQQALKKFQQVVDLIRNERQRCALIGIETDSTIMPDEAAEREDRMAFLAAAGAFLQQAAPTIQQFPMMAPLLGALMMFTVRTFPASRPLEKIFEDTMAKLEAMPPTPPEGAEGKGDDGQAAANAQVQTEQMKQHTESQKLQAQSQSEAGKLQMEKYRVDTEAAIKREEIQLNAQFKQRELDIRERELAVKEAELGIKAQQADTQAMATENDQAIKAVEAAHNQEMAERGADREDAQFSANQGNEERRLDGEDEARKAAAKKGD